MPQDGPKSAAKADRSEPLLNVLLFDVLLLDVPLLNVLLLDDLLSNPLDITCSAAVPFGGRRKDLGK